MTQVRVLHLEDNDHDAELVAGMLRASTELQPKITRVASADAFKKELTAREYDVILSDYTIPSFSGIEALRIAAVEVPETPFIFLSGTMGEESAVESLLHGATDYVLKHKPMRLESAVKRALTEAAMKRDQAVAQNLQRFQANILRNVTDGVVVTRLDAEVTYWNAGATAILRLAEKDALGKRLDSIPFGASSPRVVTLHQLAQANGELVEELAFDRASGGKVWASVKATSMKDEAGQRTGVIFIFSDITAKKEAEAAILQMNLDLEQRVNERTAALVAANAELKSFGYSVSHDLRSPLRAILGYSHILMEDFTEPVGDEGAQLIGRIVAACKRMEQLIEGLLQLSTLVRTDIDKRRVDLSALASTVLEDLADANPDRKVESEVQSGVNAHADPQMMRSALTNLLGNAWKFSSKQETAKIQFGSTQIEGERTFFVRDNGVGFDPSQASRVFESFRRMHAESDFPGTGIGLATVERIIQRHGGRIWAEAKEGGGATFYFTLPE
jgi:hypothetical protein